ncbi:MAG TPA: hypothetical protein VL633_08490 [Bacteroidota bacterium]|jgi:hypothetical protein|nr:hypothetical protein [Bacteroidota bacterium]
MLWLILGIEAIAAVVIVVQMIRKRAALRDDADFVETEGVSSPAALSLPEEEKWE